MSPGTANVSRGQCYLWLRTDALRRSGGATCSLWAQASDHGRPPCPCSPPHAPTLFYTQRSAGLWLSGEPTSFSVMSVAFLWNWRLTTNPTPWASPTLLQAPPLQGSSQTWARWEALTIKKTQNPKTKNTSASNLKAVGRAWPRFLVHGTHISLSLSPRKSSANPTNWLLNWTLQLFFLA